MASRTEFPPQWSVSSAVAVANFFNLAGNRAVCQKHSRTLNGLDDDFTTIPTKEGAAHG